MMEMVEFVNSHTGSLLAYERRFRVKSFGDKRHKKTALHAKKTCGGYI
jgi:hypothetical protein